MSEGGDALRMLFASFVFSFDGATLQRANQAVDGAKTKVGNLAQSFGGVAVAAKQRLGSAIGNVTGWSNAVKKASKDAEAGAKSSAGMFGSLQKAALGYVAALGAAKLKEFADEQIEEGEKLYRLSKRVGVGFEDLQKIGKFVAVSGVGVGSLQRPLVTLSKQLVAASNGSKTAKKTFEDLGIVFNANSKPQMLDTFYKVAAALGEMDDDTRRVTTTQKLFGNQGLALLPAFEGNAEAVEKMRLEIEEAGVAMSESFGRSAEKIGLSNRKLKSAWKLLRIDMIAQMLPAWESLSNNSAKWMKNAAGVIRETNLLKLTMLGISGVTTYKLVLKDLAALVGKYGSLTNAAQAFNKTGGAALLKWGWVALLALVFEDLYTWVNGGQSAIGKFLEKTLGLEQANEIVNTLRGFWKDFGADIAGFAGDFGRFVGGVILGTLSLLGMALSSNSERTEAWAATFLRVTKPVGDFFDWLWGKIKSLADLPLLKGVFTANISGNPGQPTQIPPGPPGVPGTAGADGKPGQPAPVVSRAPQAPPGPTNITTTNRTEKAITYNDQRHLTIEVPGATPAGVSVANKTLTQTLNTDRESTAAAFGLI